MSRRLALLVTCNKCGGEGTEQQIDAVRYVLTGMTKKPRVMDLCLECRVELEDFLEPFNMEEETLQPVEAAEPRVYPKTPCTVSGCGREISPQGMARHLDWHKRQPKKRGR